MFDAAATLSGEPAPDLSRVMQDLAGGDPRMQMLLQMIQEQQRPSNDDEVPDERDALIAELSSRLDAAEARLTKMSRIARQLHEAGRSSARLLSDLAAALGACGMCWGENPACRGCRGRGRPGMVRPDSEMRARLFGAQPPVREAASQPH